MIVIERIPVDPDVSTPAPAGHGWLDTVGAVIDWVPNTVWVALLVLLFAGSVVTLPLARRQARKAGARTAGHTTDGDRRDRALFAAAIVPAAAFLIAVLAGSQRGLVAFGRDDLHWHDGWEYLVPATLDGVGLAFGFLAFRAVRKRRNPDRAIRVAWGAATASAAINFFHESNLPGGSTLGGGYLALLSMFVMVMFHELLDQFTEGTEWIRRENPAFKLRWLTWPSNTVCAWFAWRNYPVAEGTNATVAAAVAHLDEVRAAKRGLRQRRVAEGLPPAAWWAPVVPWVRLRQVDAALVVQRAEREAERAEWESRFAAVEAEQRRGADAAEQSRLRTEHLAEQLAAEQAERSRAVAAEQSAEQSRIEAEQRLIRLREELAEQSAERTDQQERAERRNGARPKQGRSASAPNAPKLTDEQAVQAMLRAHPERGYEWSSREVHRVTGAGFGRIPRLIAMVAEHHRSTTEHHGAEQAGDGDDAEERVS